MHAAEHAAAPLVPGPELTAAQAALLRDSLLAQVDAAEHAWPGLDLGQVEAIDSAGVQLLLALQRSLAERRLTWAMTAASAPVREVLDLYGLGRLLPGAGSPA